jgi:hypothetical protein
MIHGCRSSILLARQGKSFSVGQKRQWLQGFFIMEAIDDGSYDVVVIEAEERAGDVIALQLAIASGPRRGDMVSITATGLGRSWLDLLAMPGTLTVSGGEPKLTFD